MSLNRHIEYVQFQGISRMSRVIRAFTRDRDSHSAVIDREAKDGRILIEQWPHKGGFKSWMDFNYLGPEGGHTTGTPYEIWSLEVPSDDYNWIMGKYRESAERKTPYDWSGIFDFGFKGGGDDDKTFCSEEMVKYLIEMQVRNGNMGWSRIDPVTVHPGYFRNLLIAAGARLTGSYIV